MKKLFILFTLLLQLLSPISPQQAATVITPSLKYGKPSKEELLFTTYTPDTTATALYLFHQGQSNFTYHDGFQLITEHWIRIKILKPQGTAYADVSYRGAAVLLCRERLLRQEIPFGVHDYPIPWVLTEAGLFEDGTPSRLE